MLEILNPVGSWPLAASLNNRASAVKWLQFIRVLYICSLVLWGSTSLNVGATTDWAQIDETTSAICSRRLSHSRLLVCVYRAFGVMLWGTQHSSNTCHSRTVVLHISRVSKQPRGLKQYNKSDDFIYSFNTKNHFSAQRRPWGCRGQPTAP